MEVAIQKLVIENIVRMHISIMTNASRLICLKYRRMTDDRIEPAYKLDIAVGKNNSGNLHPTNDDLLQGSIISLDTTVTIQQAFFLLVFISSQCLIYTNRDLWFPIHYDLFSSSVVLDCRCEMVRARPYRIGNYNEARLVHTRMFANFNPVLTSVILTI